jgi:6-phosphogluconolactonase (cycloisomerase 2 family)
MRRAAPMGKREFVRLSFSIALGVVALVLHVTPARAVITLVDTYVDGQEGVNGLLLAQDVVVTQDGMHVYAVSEGDDAVVRFNRDAVTGELTFVQAIVNGVAGVSGIEAASAAALSPDGNHLYVVSSAETGAVAVFQRNVTNGALAFVEAQVNGQNGVSGLSVGQDVVVSPDGAHVYAIGFSPGAVVTFARNVTTGALTFVERDQEGVNGLDGIALATACVISPEGTHLYVTGNADDSVAVFARNVTTGALSFVEVERDGVGTTDGIDGPFAIAMSADGKHVYAAGSNDDGVAVFSRNAFTGALTFVQAYHEGLGGMDGMNDPAAIAVTANGAHVLVAASAESEIGVFARDPGTGGLTFVEAIGGTNLGSVNSLRLAPGGKHLYATARSSAAVALFAVDSNATTTTSTSTSSTTTTGGSTTTLPSTTTTTTFGPTSTSIVPGTTSTTSVAPVTTSSTSTTPSTSSGPTTTSPGESTTTTTLPDTGCASVATFASIECRLATLVDQTGATMALGGLRPKLDRSVQRAADRIAAAHGSCSLSKRKGTRLRLKRASVQLKRYVRRLRGKAAQSVPAPVREPLAAEADAIAADVALLRRAVLCPFDA